MICKFKRFFLIGSSYLKTELFLVKGTTRGLIVLKKRHTKYRLRLHQEKKMVGFLNK